MLFNLSLQSSAAFAQFIMLRGPQTLFSVGACSWSECSKPTAGDDAGIDSRCRRLMTPAFLRSPLRGSQEPRTASPAPPGPLFRSNPARGSRRRSCSPRNAATGARGFSPRIGPESLQQKRPACQRIRADEPEAEAPPRPGRPPWIPRLPSQEAGSWSRADPFQSKPDRVSRIPSCSRTDVSR
jgi:hypothetical protein